MNQLVYKRIVHGISLLLGVSFISFLLMVYFGPDQTFSLIGKNATAEDINNIRHQLGYDKPFFVRYGEYLVQILTFDFGYSNSTNEEVMAILRRTLPISFLANIPGFCCGYILALLLAFVSVLAKQTWIDKLIGAVGIFLMCSSLIVIIICVQLALCSHVGFGILPVQGFEVHSLGDLLYYGTAPTLVISLITIGYNLSFFRMALLDEMDKAYVVTALAFGSSKFGVLYGHVLKNALIPILTRIIFTLPFVLVGGSLLIESFFGIPGIGQITYEAITSGDLPIVKAVVSLTTILYIGALVLAEILYVYIDPRLSHGDEKV